MLNYIHTTESHIQSTRMYTNRGTHTSYTNNSILIAIINEAKIV